MLFFMELKFYKKFFMKLEFVKLELYGKLEFRKSDGFLIISPSVINPYIICQTVVFGHFGATVQP